MTKQETLIESDWVELTRGDILSWEMPAVSSVVEFVWFVERKIRERNEPLLQRTWVGLTDEEIVEISIKSQEGISPHDDTLRFARAIEAAHGITGEKNGTR